MISTKLTDQIHNPNSSDPLLHAPAIDETIPPDSQTSQRITRAGQKRTL